MAETGLQLIKAGKFNRGETKVITFTKRQNRMFFDAATPETPMTMGYLIAATQGDTIRMLECDLWAHNVELIAQWNTRQAWIGIGHATEFETIMLGETITSGVGLSWPEIWCKVMWGSGGTGTQDQPVNSNNSYRTWTSRKTQPTIHGDQVGGSPPLAFAIYHRVDTDTSAPGIVSWVDALFEIEVRQTSMTDRVSEFKNYQHWEETHDYNYATAELYST